MTAEILVELKAKGIDKTFTYHVPVNLEEKIQIGIRVLVPFGKQTLEGFVLKIEQNKKDYEYEMKDIIKLIDEEAVITEEMLELGKYIHQKTLCNLISAYQTMLPSALKAKDGFTVPKKYVSYLEKNISEELFKEVCKTEKQQQIYSLFKNKKQILKHDATAISPYTVKTMLDKGYLKEVAIETYRILEVEEKEDNIPILTQEQKEAITTIKTRLQTFQPFLLHGVTGSGKTEVYMHILKDILMSQKEAIVLVPEISLTPQLVETFKKRFGNQVAILHSGLSQGEKYDEWRKIQKQEVKIAIGARSAIFAPFTNLGLIIIDEEHSDTYKQESNPRYNAIDIALWRAKRYQIPIVLGSATPSIESYTRAKLSVYQLIEMKTRVNQNLPTVHLVDMKEEMKQGNRIFSSLLQQKIEDRLEKKEQIILLLNRRGYSTVITCHDCGYTHKCPNCEMPLTYHKVSGQMRCHYCGYATVRIQKCPSCGKTDINEFGMGTQKLEQEIKKRFPSASIIRMDVDTTSKKGAHAQIIEDFSKNKYDILLGTQMIAKGLDFPKVTLVGVLQSDASLNIPDFRSGERTYTLLNQVAGRAGRSNLKGEVIMQGFSMDHYSILTASTHDYQGFYEKEMSIRKQLGYPPFYNLILIKIKSSKYEELEQESKKIITYLRNENPKQIILGPSMATIPKINNIYCMQIIIKCKKTSDVIESITFINNQYRTNKIQVEVDFNPFRI